MPNFYIRLRDLAFAGGDANFAQYFSGLQGSGENFNEEISGFDHAVALGAGSDNFWCEREDGGGPVSRWIRVRKAATDCPFVAYLHVAQVAGGVRQERARAAQNVRDFNLEMGGHGADANLSSFFLYIGEVADASEVDEDFGLHQSELHGRQQGVAASQNFGVIFMLGQERDCFVQAFSGDVIKT